MNIRHNTRTLLIRCIQHSSPAPRFQAQSSAPFGTPAKRNRQRSSERTLKYTSTHPAYAPFSPLSYLAMLRTFSLKTYPTKPSALSPQACAQAGWINEGGQDRLFCRVCQKAWRVELPGDVVGGIRLSPRMSGYSDISISATR